MDTYLNMLKVCNTSNMWYTNNIHMGALSIISKSENENVLNYYEND